MILVIDNFDSFTYNLVHYLKIGGATVVCKRVNKLIIREIDDLKPKGIVLSPGPGTPSDYPLLFQVMATYAGIIPILGVCLGHQAIGTFYGAKLAKSAPWHGKVDFIIHNNHEMYANVPNPTRVTRYHSLVLSQIPEELQVTSYNSQGIVMSLIHREFKIWGVQFHPEAVLTEYGLTIVQNWLQTLK